VEIVGTEGDDTVVGANFVLAESRARGTEIWAGRTTYRLRVVDGELKLVHKKVDLVNADQPLPTMAFLI
jgi:3-phenylpropionate/cinnamic acid dioxygenase small subunit